MVARVYPSIQKEKQGRLHTKIIEGTSGFFPSDRRYNGACATFASGETRKKCEKNPPKITERHTEELPKKDEGPRF